MIARHREVEASIDSVLLENNDSSFKIKMKQKEEGKINKGQFK